jgi:hypothetical protein
VKVEYIHTKTIEEASELMLAHENEFIEGILYDLNNSVMMLGNFVNDAPSKKVLITMCNKINTEYRLYVMLRQLSKSLRRSTLYSIGISLGSSSTLKVS